MIYLDHNATTPVADEVLEAMLPFFTRAYGNPGSAHAFGREAREAVERARGQVADLLGAQPSEIVFTAGGSESNNLAILGVFSHVAEPAHVMTSAIDHPATRGPCKSLEEEGHRVTVLPVDGAGVVDLDAARAALAWDTALITVHHANNEVGTLQPIAELAALAHDAGALMHTDAAQSCGKVPVDVRELGVDLLSLAGHKMYAPKGIGVLFVRSGVGLSPVLRGAGHESGRRPGTENVPGIVGLGAACAMIKRSLADERARITKLRDQLWERLRKGVPELRLNGHETLRLPNTLNVSFPGASGRELLDLTSEVAASTGSACHDGVDAPSAVLTAMGLSADVARGTIRLSLGRATSKSEVEAAAAALIEAYRALSKTTGKRRGAVS